MENTNELQTTGAGVLPFDPIVLVQDVLKRWLVILVAAIVVGVGAYIITDMSYTPKYRTSTIFVVTTRGSSTTVYNNLSSTTNVATLFTELLSSSIMRKNIMQAMGVTSLDATITTAAIPNTNLITMSVTSSDPRTAFLTTQALIEHHESLTYTVVDNIIMEVLQYPTVPTAPSNSSDPGGQMKRMALFAGLAAALVLAFISYQRDAVRSAAEAQHKLECDYLGEIPHEQKYKTLTSRLSRKKTSILIDDPVTSFHYIENSYKLLRKVERRMDGRKVVMVTSLLENEGKSTVAVNLALAMDKKHKRTLLIDCDLRKPACHAILEQRKFVSGIKEVLLGRAEPEDSILRYPNSGLDLMLARTGDMDIGDILTSQRMEQLLDWARANYDFVVLDLPPMAAASDAEGMTGLADATVMVVRQNMASAPALNKAISALDGQRAKLLGCVLNNVYTTGLTSGGGYGYGYGYGHGYGYRYGRYKKYGHYGHYGRYGRYGKYDRKK